MGTRSDPHCLQALHLLRRLVNVQVSWNHEPAANSALHQQLYVQVETDTANMVLYTNQACKWCNLQEIHLLPGCISKVLNALVEKLNYLR